MLRPIITLDGKILDGRNRFKACQEVGVDPIVEDYQGSDPLGFVISSNKERRHLTPSQKAAIAVDYLPLLEIEAKKRQSAAGRFAGKDSDGKPIVQVSQKIEQPESDTNKNKSIDQAAEKIGTNRQYVADKPPKRGV